MFDRLGRRDDETPFVAEWFVRNGVKVWSAIEGEQRFENHVDKLLNYIRYWQASGESIKTSVRIKTRMEQFTEQGYFTGRIVAHGYNLQKRGQVNKKNQEVNDIVINEHDAEIVRYSFYKYIYEGYGAQRMSHYFLENDIRWEDGSVITNTAIIRMLKNKLYIDIISNGDAESETIALAGGRYKMSSMRLADKQKEFSDYEAETINVIRRKSHLNSENSNHFMDLTRLVYIFAGGENRRCGQCLSRLRAQSTGL